MEADESAYDMCVRNGGGKLRTLESLSLNAINEANWLMFAEDVLPINLSSFEENGSTASALGTLEISGDAGVGKTNYLVKFARNCVLMGFTCLYFDLDLKLDEDKVFEKVSILLQSAEQEMKNDATQVEAVALNADEVCKRFIICRPTDSLSFLSSLYYHFEYNEDVTAPIKLVIIDSLLSFHSMHNLTDPLTAGFNVTIPQMIQKFKKRYGFAIIASKPDLNQEYVSKTWNKEVTHRLNLNTQQIVLIDNKNQ